MTPTQPPTPAPRDTQAGDGERKQQLRTAIGWTKVELSYHRTRIGSLEAELKAYEDELDTLEQNEAAQS